MAVKAATLDGPGTARIALMKSIMAVGVGLLLAIMLGLIVVLGILAPILTTFLGWTRSGPQALPLVLLAFAAAFSFYFGGMAASYKAPSRHRLHGVLVAPTAFVLSSALNLALGKGILPGVEGAPAVELVIVFLLVSTAASYVGALRGEALYAHNQKVAKRLRR
jgi:ABC-type dipeptide/oligopeptide/nickel transport system permease subunit